MPTSIPVISGFSIHNYTKDNKSAIFENLDLEEIANLENKKLTTLQKLELKKIKHVEAHDSEPGTEEQLATRALKLDSVNIELVKKQTRLNSLAFEYLKSWFAELPSISTNLQKGFYIRHAGKDGYTWELNKNRKFQLNFFTNNTFLNSSFSLIEKDKRDVFSSRTIRNEGDNFIMYQGNTFKLLNKNSSLIPYIKSSSNKGFSIYFDKTSEMRLMISANSAHHGIGVQELRAIVQKIISASNAVRKLADEIADYIIENDDVISDASNLTLKGLEMDHIKISNLNIPYQL